MNDGGPLYGADSSACRLSSGDIVHVGVVWVGPDDPTLPTRKEPHRVFLYPRDANDQPVGEPVVVVDLPSGDGFARMSCLPPVGLVVTWIEDATRTRSARWFTEGLVAKAPAVVLSANGECASLGTEILDDFGMLVACATASADDAEGSTTVHLSLLQDGGAPAPSAPLYFSIASPVTEVAISSIGHDDSGHALITWRVASGIDGRFVTDLDGEQPTLLGDAFAIFAAGETHDGFDIVNENDGLFRARRYGDWHGEQGGPSGRWVSASGTWPDDEPRWVAPALLPATTFFEREDPLISSTRWNYFAGASARRASLATAAGSVALGWRGTDAASPADAPFDGALFAVSTNEGRTWSAPLMLSVPYRGGAPAIAGDGLRWIAAWIGGSGYLTDLHVAAIGLDGSSATHAVIDCPGSCGDDDDDDRHQSSGASVATDSAGTWVVAWNIDDEIRVSRSTDGGETWSDPTVVATGAGRRGVDLEAGDDGSFGVLWSGDEVAFSRSTDGGQSWSEPVVLATGTFPEPPLWLQLDAYEQRDVLESDSRRGLAFGVQLLELGSGAWLAAFALPGTAPDYFGMDADVLVARSDDDGATWSAPAPVAPRATMDEATDDWPALTTDGASRIVATWRSFEWRGSRESDRGLAADLVGAVSEDGGATWSEPFMVNRATERAVAGTGPATLVRTARGTWLQAWQTLEEDPSSEPATFHSVLRLASAGLSCGDGVVDEGEECDDANTVDDDGCTARCLLPACGNGVVEDGEECDDGNIAPHDGCTASCRLATCGDGVVEAEREECDDANGIDTDDCLSDCTAATCGDGFLHEGVEHCDDGNRSNKDECLTNCTLAFCGDHAVHAGVEQCDDGDDDDTDACLSNCTAATCGDGHTRKAVEACDYAREDEADSCNARCFWASCPDANGDGKTTAVDAIFILKSVVGTGPHCPRLACDVNRDDAITAVDALSTLRIAIGLEQPDACKGSYGNGVAVVFRLESSPLLGSLQWIGSYAGDVDRFRDPEGNLHCEPLVPGAPFAANALPGKLILAMVSTSGFSGPMDVARCRAFPFDETPPVVTVEFTEATTVDFKTVEPRPTMSARPD